MTCLKQIDRIQCPGVGHNYVQPRIMEMGNTLRNVIFAHPVSDAKVVLEWKNVGLDRELALGGGLHNVWLRKMSDGTVRVRVFVNEKLLGEQIHSNRTGWLVSVFDTLKYRGQQATVRFEITSAKIHARHFGFAAEARR